MKEKKFYEKVKEVIFVHSTDIKVLSIFFILISSLLFPETAAAQSNIPGLAQGQQLVQIAEEYGGPIVGGLGIFMFGVEHMIGKGEGKLLKHIGNIGVGAAFIGGGATIYSMFANGRL